MIPRYVDLAGGEVIEVSWPEGPFPVEALLAASGPQTRLVFIVSPNNPTGAVATREDVSQIARALPNALVVLDAAYGEFAEEDPTGFALEFENVVAVRTFSKAWGLAGLRVGFLLGPANWIARLSASGNPFPVSFASANQALARLAGGEADMSDYVSRIRWEREQITSDLESWGFTCAAPNQANFVLGLGLPTAWIKSSLESFGIAVRIFPDREELSGAVRFSLPGNPADFSRLQNALATTLAPEALLFDLDGVLADVSRSYREAIRCCRCR